MRNRGNDELAPSEELLKDWKEGRIDWVEYERRFRKEMENPESRKRIQELRNRVKSGENVRLICYEKEPPCHRFILKDLVEQRVHSVCSELDHEECLVAFNRAPHKPDFCPYCGSRMRKVIGTIFENPEWYFRYENL